MAKVGSSAKLCVPVFKASLFNYPGGPSAKVCSSAKFCVLVFKLGVPVFKVSLLDYLGGPLAKVGLSANFGVLVFKASLLYYLGGSTCQSMFICQVLCTGIQGIYALLMGGPSAKVGLSAKLGVPVFKVSLFDYLAGVHLPSFVSWYSRHLFLIQWRVHQPK